MISCKAVSITNLRAGEALVAHRSRKRITNFRLHRPTSLREASELLRDLGPQAVVMAGGVSLVNQLKFGQIVSDLIHLGGVSELHSIREQADSMVFGALTTHWQFARAELVRRTLPKIAEVWQQVGNVRIQLKGTLGGNIMAADRAYDALPAFLALGARLVFTNGATVDLGGNGPTSCLDNLAGRGLLVQIEIPRRIRHIVVDRTFRPIVTIWLALDLDDERVAGGRVAIGCASTIPMGFALPLGKRIKRAHLGEVAGGIARDIAESMSTPISDAYASGAYRRKVAEVLLRRHLENVALGV